MMIKKTTLCLMAVLGGSVLLSACSSHPKGVRCYGVSKDGQPIDMPAGECAKLNHAKAEPLTAAESANVPHYPYNSYVKCYGVAASSMNDCGTKTTACGGTVSQAGSPDAWIAIPRAICTQLKNAVIEEPKTASASAS